MRFGALAVPAVLAGIGLFVASTPADAKSACRTVRVSTSRQSNITVTPCKRIHVGFQIGTQGEIFPTWDVSNRPAKKVLKYVRGGYENTNNANGTTTQYYLYQAVKRGHTTVKFCESTASESGCLETYKLHVTVGGGGSNGAIALLTVPGLAVSRGHGQAEANDGAAAWCGLLCICRPAATDGRSRPPRTPAARARRG